MGLNTPVIVYMDGKKFPFENYYQFLQWVISESEDQLRVQFREYIAEKDECCVKSPLNEIQKEDEE